MTDSIQINGRKIGAGSPVYIIAEMSANHHKDFDEAARIISVAKEAGADAVKLQTYTPETLTMRSDRECFTIGSGTAWSGRTLYDLYEEAYMPWEWQPHLKRIADDMGIELFSSPFDSTAVDFLEDVGIQAYKIASFELVDIPLIRRVASTGKPVIMSTGMATKGEIEEAVAAMHAAGNEQIVLLKCTSSYPANIADMNLSTIPDLRARFGIPVGLSDHSMGSVAVTAAVALGACMVEKHIVLSREHGGPDAGFSLEPDEFRAMVQSVRAVESSLGRVVYGGTTSERASRCFRRSLFAVKDIGAGEKLTSENVRSLRPADGLHPREFACVIGRKAATKIQAGTPLRWNLIALETNKE